MRNITMNQQGFTLIEGLLAAVFLGVGLLAMSSMQAVSLGRNVDASELTRVANLATEMLERIQYNRVNASQYNGIDTRASTPCPQDAVAQPMARGDCLQWDALLDSQQGFRDLQGLVTVNTAAPAIPSLHQHIVTVQMKWTGSLNNGSIRSRQKAITLTGIVAPE
jgi:type IV pilus assembly protein PilV